MLREQRIFWLYYVCWRSDFLSPSILGLQDRPMLDVCCKFGADNDIIFNSRKSVCFKVGRDWFKCSHNMRLGSLELEWVSDLKYLGIVFKTGTCLKVDVSYIKRKVYTSFNHNGVLSHSKSVDDIIKLAMVKSYCLPLLTYCLGALSLTRRCVQDLGVCWNDCFRRIFRYNRYESVKDLQFFCNELHSNSCVIWQSGNFYSIRPMVLFQFGFYLHFRTMPCLTLPKNMDMLNLDTLWSI